MVTHETIQSSYYVGATDEAFLLDLILPVLQQLRAEVRKTRTSVIQLRNRKRSIDVNCQYFLYGSMMPLITCSHCAQLVYLCVRERRGVYILFVIYFDICLSPCLQ